MARSSSYSWMPGWLRKFMNLDDELPSYGPGGYSAQDDYNAPPARPSFSYTPPAAPQRYTPSYPQAAGEEPPGRFAPSYAPPPAPPRTLGPAGSVQPDGTVSPGGNVPSLNTQGYTQPVGYLLRSYARGALPPQGLEQFTREFRATLSDVWNFYSYWTRFQTDELVRLGKEAMDTLADNLPAGPEAGSAGSTAARRIKVTVSNGEKQVDRVATTVAVDPPPEPTPAAPPAPPAPTARFSATVTADDAAVPPEGRDTADDFAARMAAAAAEVRSDIAADAGQAAARLEAGAADAAAGAAEALQSAGDMPQAAAERAAETVDEAAKDVADRLKDGEQDRT